MCTRVDSTKRCVPKVRVAYKVVAVAKGWTEGRGLSFESWLHPPDSRLLHSLFYPHVWKVGENVAERRGPWLGERWTVDSGAFHLLTRRKTAERFVEVERELGGEPAVLRVLRVTCHAEYHVADGVNTAVGCLYLDDRIRATCYSRVTVSQEDYDAALAEMR